MEKTDGCWNCGNRNGMLCTPEGLNEVNLYICAKDEEELMQLQKTGKFIGNGCCHWFFSEKTKEKVILT